MISYNILLLLLLLLHLLDHSQCNCEKLRFHNNGMVMMNLSVTAALGSWCTQPSFCTYYFAYISTLSFYQSSHFYVVCVRWAIRYFWLWHHWIKHSYIQFKYTVSTRIYRTMYYIYVNHFFTISKIVTQLSPTILSLWIRYHNFNDLTHLSTHTFVYHRLYCGYFHFPPFLIVVS